MAKESPESRKPAAPVEAESPEELQARIRVSRRALLRNSLCGALLAGAGGAGALLAARGGAEGYRWQIDPDKCMACGNCATYCVMTPSAVKCVHNFELCGYCTLCFGYYNTDVSEPVDAGAEKQRCPTGAIVRMHVDEEAYRYTIDESLCIGCGECVRGCTESANGSLFLQVRHDRCVNCNQCSIAVACPTGAFTRVPVSDPYIIKTQYSGEAT